MNTILIEELIKLRKRRHLYVTDSFELSAINLINDD